VLHFAGVMALTTVIPKRAAIHAASADFERVRGLSILSPFFVTRLEESSQLHFRAVL
jgi:hypothetical protein